MIVFTRPRKLNQSEFSSSADDEAILMTVAIGLLCENDTAAIIAADRLVATESEELQSAGRLHFTGGKAKIVQIHPNVILGYAGMDPETRVLERMSLSAKRFAKVAEVIEAIRLEPWKARVGQEVKKELFDSYDEFLKKVQATPTEPLMAAYKRMSESRNAFNMIAVGADDSGADLYFIDKNSISHDCKQTGFYIIGGGDQLAQIALLYRREFDFSMTLAEAIYRVYEAKKAAEFNEVDHKTDIGIARQGRGAWLLESEAVKELDRIYNEKRDLSENDKKRIDDIIAVKGTVHEVQG